MSNSIIVKPLFPISEQEHKLLLEFGWSSGYGWKDEFDWWMTTDMETKGCDFAMDSRDTLHIKTLLMTHVLAIRQAQHRAARAFAPGSAKVHLMETSDGWRQVEDWREFYHDGEIVLLSPFQMFGSLVEDDNSWFVLFGIGDEDGFLEEIDISQPLPDREAADEWVEDFKSTFDAA